MTLQRQGGASVRGSLRAPVRTLSLPPRCRRSATVIVSLCATTRGQAGPFKPSCPTRLATVSRRKLTTKKVGERFKRWAESTDCDAGGQHNLAGLTSLIMATVAESGECIIRRRLRRPEDGFETSLQLQVMEPDHLDHGKTEQLASGRIIQGVEFNGFGKRVAYWMYRDHPGGVLGSYETSVRFQRPRSCTSTAWSARIKFAACRGAERR